MDRRFAIVVWTWAEKKVRYGRITSAIGFVNALKKDFELNLDITKPSPLEVGGGICSNWWWE
jgi:hypothetical protein